MATCESRTVLADDPCTHAALWIVQVGDRKADAQRACARHLSMTCFALLMAELPRRAALTVRPAGP